MLEWQYGDVGVAVYWEVMSHLSCVDNSIYSSRPNNIHKQLNCTWVDSWYTEIILFLQLSAYEVHVRPTLFFWSIIWLPWLREWGDLNKQLKLLEVATRKFWVSHTSMAFHASECERHAGWKSKTFFCSFTTVSLRVCTLQWTSIRMLPRWIH